LLVSVQLFDLAHIAVAWIQLMSRVPLQQLLRQVIVELVVRYRLVNFPLRI
jgi:hypothetical protein